MKAETLNALKESIAHWERIVSGNREGGESIYSDDCPLCEMFFSGSETGGMCDGCPVAIKSGIFGCQNTPWVNVDMAFAASGDDHNDPEFIKAANKQLKFLKSLLPLSALRRETNQQKTAGDSPA